MQSKAIFPGLFAVAFLSFALAGSAEAKKGSGNGGGNQKVELEAEFEPVASSPEPDVEGDSERKTKTKDGVLKEDRFKAEVEIPIPNALGIDESNAQSADIRLILSRGGTNYAECQLVFDEVEDDDGLEAEYKLDLRIKKNGKQKARGSCDVGLPDVQDGDLGTAVLVADPSNRSLDIALLEGTYELDD
jgi:hypothetical protein